VFKDAMSKAVESLGPENLKNEKESYAVESEELNFEELMKEAKEIAVRLHKENRMNEVTAIVEKYLGQGKLLKDATPTQVETVAVIVEELRTL
jgi:hypothetical protein